MSFFSFTAEFKHCCSGDFLNHGRQKNAYQDRPFNYEMRVGLHTGNVVAGVVGKTKFQYDLWGDAVNQASRMESESMVGTVNISETTYQLLKSCQDLDFTTRATQNVKGIGVKKMYFVRRKRRIFDLVNTESLSGR